MDSDQVEKEHVNSVPSLKRRLISLQKKLDENEILRAKFPDNPDRFIASEVDLDEELKFLAPISAFPELLKPFRELSGDRILCALLSHSNPDIALAVVEILVELTDPEVLGDSTRDFMLHLLTEYDFLSVLADNLERLKEEESDEDFNGVSNILHVIDHFRDALFQETVEELNQNKRIYQWMFKRISKPVMDVVDYNRLYCVEILSSILQISSSSRVVLGLELGGLESCLVAYSNYRKKDWESLEEEEYLMNLKNCIYSMLLDPRNRDEFHKQEGCHLMIKIMKSKSRVYSSALSILDVALTDHVDNATAVIQGNGLGLIFALFMGGLTRWKEHSRERSEELEIVLSIVMQLCELCKGTEQSRLMAKFFEDGGAKLKRVCLLHIELWEQILSVKEDFVQELNWTIPKNYAEYDPEVSPSQETIKHIIENEVENDIYAERGEMGLLALQLIDRIFLRLCHTGNHIMTYQCHVLLDRTLIRGEPMIKSWTCILREYADHLVDGEVALKEREDVLQLLKSTLENHERMIEKSKELEHEAAHAAKLARDEAASKAVEISDNARRERNRRRKVKEKMRKFDRELEYKERLEEFRWNRKHGLPG